MKREAFKLLIEETIKILPLSCVQTFFMVLEDMRQFKNCGTEINIYNYIDLMEIGVDELEEDGSDDSEIEPKFKSNKEDYDEIKLENDEESDVDPKFVREGIDKKLFDITYNYDGSKELNDCIDEIKKIFEHVLNGHELSSSPTKSL